MPGFDTTGPRGQGSQAGRGLGKCSSDNQRSTEQLDFKEYSGGLGGRFRRGLRRGLGLGKNNGKGMGRRFGGGNS